MSSRETNRSIILAALIQHAGRLAVASVNDEYKHESLKFFKALKEKFDFLEPHFTFFESYINGNIDEVEKLTGKAEEILLKSEFGAGISGFEKLSGNPLTNILSKVEIDDNRKLPKGNHCFSPGVVNNFFNLKKEYSEGKLDESVKGNVIEENKKLFSQLQTELLSFPLTEVDSFIDTLLNMYEKYFSFSASNITNNQDVSFYDEVRTAAALVSCLSESENKEEPFILLNADFSGIQPFLYSNQNPIENFQKGLNKRLRGKSFYLSLLSELATDYFLRELNLTKSNLLMNGGGHFILLIPNSEKNILTIEKVKKEFQLWLFKEYRGSLTFNIAYLQAGESLYEKFEEWYAALSDKLLDNKRKKNFDILDEIADLNLDVVRIENLTLTPDKDDDDEVKKIYKKLNKYGKSNFHKEKLFQYIGENIPKAQYFIKVESENKSGTSTEFLKSCINFDDFGISYYLIVDNGQLKKLLEYLSSNTSAKIFIYTVNEKKIIETQNLNKFLHLNLAFGIKFIANQSIESSGFAEYAKLDYEREKEGDLNDKIYPLLSVLRMDVDNLGSVFLYGLKRDEGALKYYSLARSVAVSRLFNLFFTVEVNRIAKEYKLYVTYSGGDDLFIVGSWINILLFAKELRKAFSEFACGNNNLTLSAGIFICKDNYPIGKGAEKAGEAEGNAKSYKSEDNYKKPISENIYDKDSISVFGRVYKWNELSDMLNYGNEIYKLTQEEKGKIKAGYIHFLLSMVEKVIDKEQKLNLPEFFKFLPKIKYSFARRGINQKEIDSNQNNSVRLLSKLITGENWQYYLKNFRIPAYYTILKNRSSKN